MFDDHAQKPCKVVELPVNRQVTALPAQSSTNLSTALVETFLAELVISQASDG